MEPAHFFCDFSFRSNLKLVLGIDDSFLKSADCVLYLCYFTEISINDSDIYNALKNRNSARLRNPKIEN